MRKIIISQPGCSRCKMLHEQVPDTEVVEIKQELLLALARELDIRSLPIVVLTGEPQELANILKE